MSIAESKTCRLNGLFVRDKYDGFLNRFHHAYNILNHLVIPKSQNLIPLCFKKHCPGGIVFRLEFMPFPV
jgi:hypothetical protein